MSLMAAFVGVAPASAFLSSTVGRSLTTRRDVKATPMARRPRPPGMMAEDFGEWKKKADKKGSKSTTAEKTNATVKVDDEVQSISENNTESNVTAFQPPTVDTTVFRCVGVDGRLPGCSRPSGWSGSGWAAGWEVGCENLGLSCVYFPTLLFCFAVSVVRFSNCGSLLSVLDVRDFGGLPGGTFPCWWCDRR